MGAGDLELLDLTYVVTDDDEPRLKVGDVVSGEGVGQDCAYLCTDGFVSMPNPPDGNGGAAQGLVWTSGNDRAVVAAQDGRYNVKAGSLTSGDRAIVSNCDAALKLSRTLNKIQLLASAQQLQVTVDADGQRVFASAPNLSIALTASGGQFVYGNGGTLAQVEVLPTGVVLSYLAASQLCSITLGLGGTVAIVAPGGVTVTGPLTVNGVPVP